MLKVSSIALLIFYLGISIGVQVDVDTCCKQILSLSIIDESEKNLIPDDCCTAAVKNCCENNSPIEKGCPSETFRIQILQEAPQSSYQTDRESHCTDLALDIYSVSREKLTVCKAESLTFYTPPLIPITEDLFILYSAHITYG